MKKMAFPLLKCQFDKTHSLYKDKKDAEPLMSCRLKGDLHLPLVELAVGIAAGALGASLLCACISHKLSGCKKR